MSPLILPASAGKKNTKSMKYQLILGWCVLYWKHLDNFFSHLAGGGYWKHHTFLLLKQCKLFRGIHLHLYSIILYAWLPSFYWLNICPTVTFIEYCNSIAASPTEPVSCQVRAFCYCQVSSFQIRVVSSWTTKDQNCYSDSYFYFNYTYSSSSLQSAGTSLPSNRETYFFILDVKREQVPYSSSHYYLVVL